MLLSYWKVSVETKDWYSYGHRPSATPGKPLESKYVQQLISKRSPHTYKFHGKSRFIDNLSTMNDDGEFFSSCKYIYPKQLKLKLEHQ